MKEGLDQVMLDLEQVYMDASSEFKLPAYEASASLISRRILPVTLRYYTGRATSSPESFRRKKPCSTLIVNWTQILYHLLHLTIAYLLGVLDSGSTGL